MVFEVHFQTLGKKVRHLFPEGRFGIFYLTHSTYIDILEKELGLKYLSCREDEVSSSFMLKFEVVNKKNYSWAKLKYGI